MRRLRLLFTALGLLSITACSGSSPITAQLLVSPTSPSPEPSPSPTAEQAATITFTTQPSGTAASGVSFTSAPVVQVLTASSKSVEAATVTLTAHTDAACASAAAGSLSGATAQTNTEGRATFSSLSQSLAGVYYWKAVSGSLSACSSGSVTVTAGSAASVAFTTQPSSSANTGVAFSTQPVIRVLDASGNAVSGASVALTAFTNSQCTSAASATLSSSSANTNASGNATFSGVAASQAGTIYLKATSGSASTCSNAIAVTNLTYSATILTDTPAGFWRLGDAGTQGSSAPDTSGNSHNGTYTESDASTSSGGILSDSSHNASVFDGSSGYVSTSYAPTSLGALSVEAWVKTTANSGLRQIIYSNRGSSGNFGVTLYLTKNENSVIGAPCFIFDGQSTAIGVQSLTAVNDGNWHHIVATWSAASGATIAPSQITLYVDGVAVTNTATVAVGNQTAPYVSSGDPAEIGRQGAWNNWNTGNRFEGAISDVAVYETALSASRVAAHYHAAGY